jgi:hypothetical protein
MTIKLPKVLDLLGPSTPINRSILTQCFEFRGMGEEAAEQYVLISETC